MTEGSRDKPQGAGAKPDKGPGSGRIVAYAAIVVCLLALCVGAYYVVSAPGAPGDDGNETIAVPGHPDWYMKPLDVFYTNGTRIAITENRNAVDPGYWQLVSFLQDDPTEHGVYETGHECSSFAVELHDRAESINISAHIVLVSLSNAPLHMVVGFNTRDNGTVYIDDTGLTQEEIDRDLLIADRTANLTVGATYIRHYLPPFDFDEDPDMGTVENVSLIS